jgi:hypothetical protein
MPSENVLGKLVMCTASKYPIWNASGMAKLPENGCESEL